MLQIFILLCSMITPLFSLGMEDKCSCKIAVAIIAYNRPEYLERCLKSIERNPESQSLPFYFFLDGGPDATQEENHQLIASSSIAHREIILRPRNYGIIKNHFDSKRFLFDQCHYDKVIVIEEDVEFTSDYFAKLLSLDRWARSTYDNIGSTQLWSECKLSRAEKCDSILNVKETKPFWSFVTYCIHKKAWNAISPYLYEYEKLFVDPLLDNPLMAKARSKPECGPFKEAIWTWHQKILNSKLSPLFLDHERCLPPKIVLPKVYYIYNQDMLTAYFLAKKGLIRLQTIVNHAKHIGENGFLGRLPKSDFMFNIEEIPLPQEPVEWVYRN